MFMGKTEWGNVKNLFLIRKKECSGISFLYTWLGILFLSDSLGLISNVIKYKEDVTVLTMQEYTSWGIILTLIAGIYETFNYKEYNTVHGFYPQNKRTRFLSYVLFLYENLFKVQILALGFYLLQYGLSLLCQVIKKNIAFAYEFNLSFVISGFCVMLALGVLLLSLIILLGALDRKFTWYFRILFTIAVIILLRTFPYVYIDKIAGFFTREPSVILFIVKAVVLGILFLGLSCALNSYTENLISKLKQNKLTITLTAVVAAVACFLLMLNPVSYKITTNETTEPVVFFTKDHGKEWGAENKFILDAKDIPAGTTLKLKYDDQLKKYYDVNVDRHRKDIPSGQIVIDYRMNGYDYNQIDIIKFLQPKLKADLAKDSLNIEVISKRNVKVVMLYPYSRIMRNFTKYKDKNLYKENDGTSSGFGRGAITISLPSDGDIRMIR